MHGNWEQEGFYQKYEFHYSLGRGLATRAGPNMVYSVYEIEMVRIEGAIRALVPNFMYWIQIRLLSNGFVCFELQEEFFSYLTTDTITGDMTCNLDICLTLTAFSSEGSFTCHTYCDMGPPFLMSYWRTCFCIHMRRNLFKSFYMRRKSLLLWPSTRHFDISTTFYLLTIINSSHMSI
jgi:hypothetical protein